MVSFDLKRKIPFYAKAFVLIVFVSFIAAGDDGRSAKAVISVDFAKPAANVKSMSGFLHGLYKTARRFDSAAQAGAVAIQRKRADLL
jgi:hypothetical protein